MPSRADLIRSFFAAYMTRDRAVVENAMTEDFTFTSPYDDAISKADYFERCWPNCPRIREHILERIFVEDEEAFVTYRCVTEAGMDFRNTEFYVFDGDKLRAVHVYFGASYKDGAFAPSKSGG